MIRRTSLTAGLSVALASVVLAPSAGAATQIGQTFVPSSHCDGSFNYLQTGSPGNQYIAPFAGVITSWSFQSAGSSLPLKLKIARPVGGNAFTIVGHSDQVTPPQNAFSTYPVRIPVQAGDVLGLRTGDGDPCARSAAGYSYHGLGTVDPAPGTTAFFSPFFLDFQLGISAALEPDCDEDGFGDESQDPTPGDCEPPETTIVSGPKDRTRQRQTTIAFNSSEPDSSFECMLDGRTEFKPCTSPIGFKVKKGKHTFAVQATDAAGNTDASPATDDWKVKKKRK